MKIKLIFTVLLVAIVAAGCTSTPQQPAAAASDPQLQSFAASANQSAPENAGPVEITSGEYPTSPEGVVQAFLSTFAGNPEGAVSYISAGAQANLNPERFAAVLQLNGAIEDFMIDQAAVNPDLPGAFIGVAVQVAGSEVRRDFTLTIENGMWKIETITIPAT
jgi:hypothetical protein